MYRGVGTSLYTFLCRLTPMSCLRWQICAPCTPHASVILTCQPQQKAFLKLLPPMTTVTPLSRRQRYEEVSKTINVQLHYISLEPHGRFFRFYLTQSVSTRDPAEFELALHCCVVLLGKSLPSAVVTFPWTSPVLYRNIRKIPWCSWCSRR